MLAYIVRRLISAIPTFLGAVTVVFFIMRLIPGDAALLMLGDNPRQEALDLLRSRLGLDRPLHVQYGTYIFDVVRGDFGRSIRTSRPVMSEVLRVLPFTAVLAITGTIIGSLLGIAMGIVSGTRRNSAIDYFVSVVSLTGVSMPIFTIGIILLVVFSYALQWLPATGAGRTGSLMDAFRHLLLPSLALGVSASAIVARMTRSSVLEILSLDFVRTAHAKGLRPHHVVVKHVLKNAMIPVVTIVGLNFGRLLSGTVITETLFVRPGLGRLLIDALYARDYPQVEAAIAFFALSFIIVNLLVDLSYAALDPRIQYS